MNIFQMIDNHKIPIMIAVVALMALAGLGVGLYFLFMSHGSDDYPVSVSASAAKANGWSPSNVAILQSGLGAAMADGVPVELVPFIKTQGTPCALGLIVNNQKYQDGLSPSDWLKKLGPTAFASSCFGTLNNWNPVFKSAFISMIANQPGVTTTIATCVISAMEAKYDPVSFLGGYSAGSQSSVTSYLTTVTANCVKGGGSGKGGRGCPAWVYADPASSIASQRGPIIDWVNSKYGGCRTAVTDQSAYPALIDCCKQWKKAQGQTLKWTAGDVEIVNDILTQCMADQS